MGAPGVTVTGQGVSFSVELFIDMRVLGGKQGFGVCSGEGRGLCRALFGVGEDKFLLCRHRSMLIYQKIRCPFILLLFLGKLFDLMILCEIGEIQRFMEQYNSFKIIICPYVGHGCTVSRSACTRPT